MEKKKKTQNTGLWADVIKEFKKNKGSIVGLIVLGIIVIVAIVSVFVLDYKTQIVKLNIREALQPISSKHFFGTDQFGRDIFLRILYGAHYSLLIGICAVAISTVIGSMLGIIAGYFGGITETFIMRFMDVISPIPTILLGIAIASAFGQSLVSLMIAVGVVSVPSFARIARASVMTVRDQEYIEAAKSMSASDLQIIVSHIIPNSFAPILVQATMRVASAIIAASSLSFLGLGVPAPQPEWGGMLSEGRSFIRSNTNMTLFPGIAIMITVLSINLIGDGVRDAMDPRLKR
jgi:peptide/nickel transport system permease protein